MHGDDASTPTNQRGLAAQQPLDSRVRSRLAKGLQNAIGTTSKPPAPAIPNQLGEYQVLSVLGQGGMGIVYKARHRKLNRTVAIKTIRPHRFAERKSVERFFFEAEAVARLDHPGVVPVYEIVRNGDECYFAMRFMPGGSLARATGTDGVDDHQAATWTRQIALAIEHAHGRGLIHRDLKPGNILLDEAGNAQVADFGLAKAVEATSQLTLSGEILGTPAYMAPEQARSDEAEVSSSVDVYAIGGILYFLLTGKPPFAGKHAVDVFHQLLHDAPRSPREIKPSIHRDLETIAMKCLSKSPADRYRSAFELSEELRRHLEDRPIEARPVSSLARLGRWCRRNRAVATLIMLFTVTLIGGSAVSAYFGFVANQRATSLAESNAALTVAESKANRSAIEAQEHARLANQQALVAITGFETIVYDLQETLVDNPEALGQRRRLLKLILEELESLPADMLAAQRIQRCKATAMFSLAEVAMEGGDDDGLSGMAASKRYYESAIDLFRQLHDESDDKLAYARDLGEALTEYGDTSADARQWAQALALFTEADQLYSQLKNAPPDSPAFRRNVDTRIDWALNRVLAGEALTEMSRFEEAEPFLISAYDELKTIVEKKLGDERVAGLGLGRAIRKIGDWHVRKGQVQQAQQRFTEFATTSSVLAQKYPLDIDCVMESSTAYERLGNVQRQQNDLAAAKQSFRRCLELTHRLETATLKSQRLQWDLSFGYQKYAEICIATGDWDEAKRNAEKCVAIRTKVEQSNIGSPWHRSKLAGTLSMLARIYRHEQQWQQAITVYEQAIDVWRRSESESNRQQHRKQIDALELQIAECRSRLPSDSE
ncbi:MAG: serine/threonine-protein kinase [Pirellulaceae bacterium]